MLAKLENGQLLLAVLPRAKPGAQITQMTIPYDVPDRPEQVG